MAIERKKFRDIFQENPDGTLTLLFNVKIKETEFPLGTKFDEKTGLGGVNFHQFRYLDVAVQQGENALTVEGFYNTQN